jgi:alanyl-tRNA synthetase
VAGVLKTDPTRVVDTARSLTDHLKATEARLGEFEDRDRAGAAETLIKRAEVLGSATLVVGRIDGIGGDGLRSLAFQIRDRVESGIGVLGTVTDGKAALIIFITDDLAETGISAGEIAGVGAKALGGGASPDPLLAQAGGPNADAMDDALDSATQAARSALTSS